MLNFYLLWLRVVVRIQLSIVAELWSSRSWPSQGVPIAMLKQVLLLSILLGAWITLCQAAGHDDIDIVATYGAGKAPPGTLCGDVSVLVALKESHGLALGKLMAEIPSDMTVHFVVYTPYTDPQFWVTLAELDAEYENLELLWGAPPYSNVGGARRYAIEQGVIKTKYFLAVENIGYTDPGLVQHLYAKAEELRAEEAAKGMPLTVSFVPGMLEVCDKGSKGMWGRDLLKSHAFWSPSLQGHDDGTSYFVSGYMSGISDKEFGSGSELGRWNKTLKRVASKQFTHSGVDGAYYVNFLEDHVFLQETAFFRDHVNEYCFTDCLWKNDMFHMAAVPLFFDRRLAFIPGPLGRMEFFCDWSPETLHQFAWRRSDAYMTRSCLLEEMIYGYTAMLGNCWAWMGGFKDGLFNKIRVKDVRAEFPNFLPDVPLSALRHANLMFSAFLFSSHNEFRFQFRNRNTGKMLYETGWVEHTDALRFVLAELGEAPEGTRTDQERDLFVYMRQRILDIRSDEYQDLLLSRRERLTHLPGAYDSKVASRPLPRGQKPGGIITELPGYCLYHTGFKTVQEFGDGLADLKLKAVLSTIRTSQTGEEQTNFFLWTDGTRKCPAKLETPFALISLITGEDIPVQLPAFDGDSSLAVGQYRYHRVSI